MTMATTMHPEDDHPATLAEGDRQFAEAVGAQRQEQAWILSDRDVWYRNPFYRGPAVPHPEEDHDYDDL